MFRTATRLIVSLVIGACLTLTGCEDDNNSGSASAHLPLASEYGITTSGAAALVIRNDTPNHIMKSLWVSHEHSDGPIDLSDLGPGDRHILELSPGWAYVRFRSWTTSGHVRIGTRYETGSISLVKNKACFAIHYGDGSENNPTGVRHED